VIVLDASVVVELVLGTSRGQAIAARIADSTVDLHAPHLLDVEVAQVVRRYVLAGQVTVDRGRAAFDHLRSLDLERHPHDVLLPRIWSLKHNLTAYDAAYVALAEALDAPLLTTDRKLVASTGHAARIELVA
jgi:predicted nucleic acid-binding protein